MAQGAERGIVNGVGLTVDLEEEFVAGGIGTQVDTGGKEGAHEAAGVVVSEKGFPDELDQCRFGAVGDEFNGVDKVLSSSAQLSDALFGGQVFEFDMLRGGFASDFEDFEFSLCDLQSGEGGSFLFFVTGGDLRLVILRSKGMGSEECLGLSRLM